MSKMERKSPEDVNNEMLRSDINLEIYCPFYSKDFVN